MSEVRRDLLVCMGTISAVCACWFSFYNCWGCCYGFSLPSDVLCVVFGLWFLGWTSGCRCLACSVVISVTRMAPIIFPLCSFCGMLLRFLSAFSIGVSVAPYFLRLYGVLVEYMATSQGRCFEAIRFCFVVEI